MQPSRDLVPLMVSFATQIPKALLEKKRTMGGGNGQKSKTARDRNNEKKLKEAKQKNRGATKEKMAADKVGIKCKICMTTFMITASVSFFFLLFFLFSDGRCCQEN